MGSGKVIAFREENVRLASWGARRGARQPLDRRVIMKKLFEATSIRSLTLENRFVRSGTWLGLANPDGSCSQKLEDRMVELARGGVGLVVCGFAFVSRAGTGGALAARGLCG